MARFLVQNLTNLTLIPPAPFSRTFKPAETITFDDVTVSQADNPQVADAINRGLIRVTAANDPDVDDNIEGATLAAATGSNLVPEISHFTIRPGGTEGGADNVYNDWVSLWAAVTAVAGQRVILVDDDLVSPVVVSAGTYDFERRIEIWGTLATGFGRSVLELPDGVVFQNLARIDKSLDVEYVGTSTNPVISGVAGPNGYEFQLGYQCSLLCSSTSPFFRVDDGDLLNIHMMSGSTLFNGTSAIVTSTGLLSTINIRLADGSTIENNTVAGGSDAQFIIEGSSAVLSQTQVALTGAFNQILEPNAAQVGYSPTAPASWPTNLDDVAEALDHVAGVLPGERVITVGSTSAFTTIEAGIAAAVALTPPPSVANPAVVTVVPGTYSENNPLVVPTGISVETIESAGVGASAVVTPVTPTAPVFDLTGNRCGVAGFFITGASGPGGVGVRANLGAATDSCMVRRCFITGCETGLIHNQGVGIYLDNQALKTTAAMVTAVDVTGGQFLAVTNQFGGTPGSVVSDAFLLSGGGVTRVTSTNFQDATNAITVSGGSLMRVAAGALTRCVNGLDVSGASTLEADAFKVEERVGANLDLVVDATSTVFWAGGLLAADRLNIDPAATTVINSGSLRANGQDPSLLVIAELSVGTETLPREAAFGEGDSHQRGLAVLTNTNGEVGTWNDLTTDFLNPTTSVPILPGTGVGNTFYVGGDFEFVNLKVEVDVAGVAGGGAANIEYWDGASWLPFTTLSTDADFPYDQYGNIFLQRGPTSEQIRWEPHVGWAQKTLNGINKYWIRITVIGAITTSPELSFVKLGTNRTEINGDGFAEYFGRAEPIREVLWHQRLGDDLGGASPGNATINFATNINLTLIDNNFVDGVTDGAGQVFLFPEGLDTSRPLRLTFGFTPGNNATGDVLLEVRYALVQPGDLLNGAIAPTVIQTPVTIAAPSLNILQVVNFDLSIPGAVPGDIVAVSYRRLGADAADTFAGNWEICYTRLTANFWR